MLPMCQETLQVYFCHHKIKGMSLKDAIKNAVDQLTVIRQKARVPIAEERSIVRKLETVLEKYRNLCHNMNRRGPTQEAREKEFENSTKQLFDIAHHLSMEMMKIEQDKQFLTDQCGERKMCMGKVDEELTALEDRRTSRLQKEEIRKIKETRRQQEDEYTARVVVHLVSILPLPLLLIPTQTQNLLRENYLMFPVVTNFCAMQKHRHMGC